jgi:hypothetical protein
MMRSRTWIFVTTLSVCWFISSMAFGSILEISPKVSVSEAYTDNASLLRNNTKSDFVTTVSPSINVDYLHKHAGLKLFYDYQHKFYRSETQNNSSRHDAGISAWADLSKYTHVTLGQRFQRVEDTLREQTAILLPSEDPYLSRDTTLTRTRQTYYTFSSNAGLSHQFGENDVISFNYLYSLREDAATNGNSNHRHEPGVTLNYWFTPQFGINTFIKYTRGQFDNYNFDDYQGSVKLIRKITRHFNSYIAYRHVWRDYHGQVTSGTQTDYQLYEPSLGVSYQLEKNTSISVGAGYFYQEFKDGNNKSGPFADISLTQKWTFSRGSVNLAGMSGLDRNEFGAENRGFERYYGIIGKLDYELTRHLSSSFGISLRRNDYINDTNDRTDNRIVFHAGLDYRLTRWMTVFTKGSYSYLHEDTTANSTTVTANGAQDKDTSVSAGISFRPERWVMISLSYTYHRLDTDLSNNSYNENRAALSVTLFPVRPYRKVY